MVKMCLLVFKMCFFPPRDAADYCRWLCIDKEAGKPWLAAGKTRLAGSPANLGSIL
jgi:hypothetical protein